VLKNWGQSLGKISKKHRVTWLSFFKKLLSRARFKIERKTKSLIALMMGLEHNNSNDEIIQAFKET